MYKAHNYTWTYSWLSLKNMLSTNPQSSSKENNICSHYLIWSRYNFGGRSPTLQIRKLRLRACNQKVLVSDYRTQVLPTHHITSNSVFKYPTCRQRFFHLKWFSFHSNVHSYLTYRRWKFGFQRPDQSPSQGGHVSHNVISLLHDTFTERPLPPPVSLWSTCCQPSVVLASLKHRHLPQAQVTLHVSFYLPETLPPTIFIGG